MNRFEYKDAEINQYYQEKFSDNIDPVSIGAAVTTAITVGKQIFGKAPKAPEEQLKEANIYYEILADHFRGIDWNTIRNKWVNRIPRAKPETRMELAGKFLYPAPGQNDSSKIAWLLENINNELNQAGLPPINETTAKQLFDLNVNLITAFQTSAGTAGMPGVSSSYPEREIDYGMQPPDKQQTALTAEIFKQPSTLIMIAAIGLILVFAIFRK